MNLKNLPERLDTVTGLKPHDWGDAPLAEVRSTMQGRFTMDIPLETRQVTSPVDKTKKNEVTRRITLDFGTVDDEGKKGDDGAGYLQPFIRMPVELFEMCMKHLPFSNALASRKLVKFSV